MAKKIERILAVAITAISLVTAMQQYVSRDEAQDQSLECSYTISAIVTYHVEREAKCLDWGKDD